MIREDARARKLHDASQNRYENFAPGFQCHDLLLYRTELPSLGPTNFPLASFLARPSQIETTFRQAFNDNLHQIFIVSLK